MLRYVIRPLVGWDGERTAAFRRRPRSAFKAAWSSTLDLLDRERAHLRARDLVMQVAVHDSEIRLDGMLRADARPSDPGVRLLFGSRYGDLTYQCDSCQSWQHNVRSIALGLEALRAVDRYGINAVQGQQYKGCREITAGSGTTTREQAEQIIRHWSPDDDLRTAYKTARRNTHPDLHGGQRQYWDAVEQAAETLGLKEARNA